MASVMTNHNWQSILKTALAKLRKFAGRIDFDISLQKIFGVTGEDTALLKQAWLTGNFGTLPNLEIIASSQINNARGAFAAATNTLHLSDDGIYRYKHPDPSWDYAEVYDQASVIQSDIANFIDWLSKNEAPDSSIDKQAKAKLDDLIEKVAELRDLF